MSQILEELKSVSCAMKPTGVFLAEWQNKPGHQLLMMKSDHASNYMVMKAGTLLLWAHTVDVKESIVTLHSRDEMIARMGEDHILQMEARLQPAVH